MLRLSTLCWALIAVAVGLFLYQVKHEVQGLEQQLARTNRAIGAAHERIHVLHAEWSLLNEPDRLRALATRHLDLVPMRPAQFAGTQAIAALPAAAPTVAVAEAPTQPAAPVVAASQHPQDAAPRAAVQREEPLPRPRQAAPAPRRELDASAPRPLMPQASAAGAAVAASARPPSSPVITVSAVPPPALAQPVTRPITQPVTRPGAASSLGAPVTSLPPPVPRVVGGN
jgi:hypothetical protein